MATATLQSFNVFLTERLTAAAVDIYGFVEKTIADYQEEVYRTKMENQRLQRLLDLVYKPEIRLHRADTRQIDLPAPTQEVSAQEQHTEMECILNEVKEELVSFKVEHTEAWPRTVEMLAKSGLTDTPIVGKYSENLTPNSLTQVLTVGEQSEGGAPYIVTQVNAVEEPVENEIYAPQDPTLPLLGASQLCKRKKKTFYCYTCPQSFQKKVELKRHLASHATEPTNKDLTCFVCGRITNTRSQMLTHMRVHTGEKPFDCSICGKRYKLKSHIKEHLRIHTGVKPFTCYICGKHYHRSYNLIKHAWIKHREVKPFKCTQCNECFPRLLLFKQHMKIVHQITLSL